MKLMPKPKKRTRRTLTHRPLAAAEKARWDQHADALLAHAVQIHNRAQDFDTAVRDSVAQGLAYLVHAAYDCRSIAQDFRDLESSVAFIDTSTAEWFRQRGYVEWFCHGAAELFHTTRPRSLALQVVFGRKGKR